MFVEEADRHPFQGRGEGADLGQDVDAVLVFLDHPVDATGLSFDPLQPRQIAVLFVDVAVGVPVFAHFRTSFSVSAPESFDPAPNERSRRLLPTTKTLEKAIAAPASMGLSRPSAASGIAATL